jgi:bifunctional non-homologous end joining protein LigD
VESSRVEVEVEGRRLRLTNLEKVLYPATPENPEAFTKGQIVDYYARIAPVMLTHLRARPVTFVRWPDGVTGHAFFEKNAPSHTPDWVRRVRLAAPGSTMGRDTIDYVVIDDLPTLVWAASLAALELHVPQWQVVTDGTPSDPDLLVLDLDPGEGATIVECCSVARRLQARLAEDGLDAYPKTSGSKGMQVVAPLEPTPAHRTSGYAKALAEELERQTPATVVSRMAKNERKGRVFIDWSQNNAAKTTISAYSLRARVRPTVSTPVTWDEVDACRTPADLAFTAPQVLERIEALGDLMAALEPSAESTSTRQRRGRIPEPTRYS